MNYKSVCVWVYVYVCYAHTRMHTPTHICTHSLMHTQTNTHQRSANNRFNKILAILQNAAISILGFRVSLGLV
jgi:hypothetical protein